MKKILFIRHTPTECPWYVENHIEYIIRYLGSKYYFDLAMASETINDGFHKNPNDYDLLVPLLTTHTHMENPEKFYHKMAGIVYEPGEIGMIKGICYASTNPITDQRLEEMKLPYVKTRFGIDTDLFEPYNLIKEDNLLRVGVIGKCHSPRKLFKDLLLPLADLKGVRLMVYSQQPLPEKELEYCGGKKFVECLEGGNKSWIGMPNIYNSIDVLVETDCDLSVSFPTLEAVSCGIPVICTPGGLSGYLKDAGAGIELLPKRMPIGKFRNWAYDNPGKLAERIKKAVIYLRDNPEIREEMGQNGRDEVLSCWEWRDLIHKWDEFFTKALKLAK